MIGKAGLLALIGTDPVIATQMMREQVDAEAVRSCFSQVEEDGLAVALKADIITVDRPAIAQ